MSGVIPPLPQYAFMAWCSVKKKHGDNFTFTLLFWIAKFHDSGSTKTVNKMQFKSITELQHFASLRMSGQCGKYTFFFFFGNTELQNVINRRWLVTKHAKLSPSVRLISERKVMEFVSSWNRGYVLIASAGRRTQARLCCDWSNAAHRDRSGTCFSCYASSYARTVMTAVHVYVCGFNIKICTSDRWYMTKL